MNSKKANIKRNQLFHLGNHHLTVVMHPYKPLLLEYHTVKTKQSLHAALPDDEPDVQILRTADGTYEWTSDGQLSMLYSAQKDENSILYTITLLDKSKTVASFDIRFNLQNNELLISLEHVREKPGYQFMCLRMPPIISVSQNQPNANLVICTHGGRRIPVRDCPPHEMMHYASWFNIASLGMVYHNKLVGLMHIPSTDDILISSIREDDPGSRFGTLSVLFRYRIHAHTPNLQFIAGDPHCCRVALTEDQNGDQQCDWTDGAIYWHRQVEAEINPLYEKAYVYKIFQDYPTHQQFVTFDEALEIIRRVHRLTDGAPQIVYLVGWQHRGHDTGYPDVFTVNERLGGMERLQHLITEAKKLNAIVSFHDNYEDAYPDDPGWNEDIIARDYFGNLMLGGFWGNHQAWIIGSAYYAEHGAAERVSRTLDTYPIEQTYHIDVLSAEVRRYDWRPGNPASAMKTLEGKYRIIGYFNERGIDITSEGFTEQFIGRIGYSYHLWRERVPVYPVESRVPVIPFLYHGKTLYAGTESKHPVQDGLHYGAGFMTDYTKDVTDEVIAYNYYLRVLPATLVWRLPMWRYEEHGAKRKVYYSEDTFVEIDEEENLYRMVVGGREVTKNYSIWFPISKNKALTYSIYDGKITYIKPNGWENTLFIHAYDLMDDRPADIQPSIDGNHITVTLSGGHPYRIEYKHAKHMPPV